MIVQLPQLLVDVVDFAGLLLGDFLGFLARRLLTLQLPAEEIQFAHLLLLLCQGEPSGRSGAV
ncbi:hypothetical protein D3C84_1295420 [compost metagenome]